MIDEKTDKPRGSFWRELPILIVVAVLVAWLVRAFVVQTFYIPSGSMEQTLERWDRVLVNKLVYNFREPQRGEIVVFKAPYTWSHSVEGEDFIKRVIGVPGDHVVCCDDQGRLIVNGKPLDEPYVYPGDAPAKSEFDITVPPGRLWVMGDHRSASGDSLQQWTQYDEDINIATIPTDDVVGRAFTIFWPFDRATWLSVPDGYSAIPNS
ncbi:signal peptidase I [Melissospora conviva]|uniref:signal peptidase I n=1 Tax=Melissospora conviva TaxID=3388432 RepID=UPI003B7F5F7B